MAGRISHRFAYVMVLGALLLLGAGILMAGCGSTTTTTAAATTTTAAGSSTTATTAATTTTAPLPKIKAKIGTTQPVEGKYTEAVKAFAQRVSDATGGNFTIEVYPAQQLGTAREMIENLQKGGIEMVCVAAGNFTPFWAPMAIVGLPYLLTEEDDVTSVLLEGAPGQELLDSLNTKAIQGLAFWPSGFMHTHAKKEIITPDDLKGLKIRILENPVLQAQYQALGATAVAINYAELYNSLQQGVVDGLEIDLGGLYDSKLYEVVKYSSFTQHGLFSLVIAGGKAWFDGLPAEYQKVLTDEAKVGGMELFAAALAAEQSTIVPAMEAAGMTITELTAEQRAAFEAIGGPPAEAALRGMMDETGGKILDDFKAALGK